MKKKLIIGSVLAVFLLLSISLASVVSSETNTVEIKDSPLYGIRTDRAIEDNAEEASASYVGENNEFIAPSIEITEEDEAFLLPTGFTTCPSNCPPTNHPDCPTMSETCWGRRTCRIICRFDKNPNVGIEVPTETNYVEIKDSPLYKIRTERYLEEESIEVSTSYIGENTEFVVPLEQITEEYDHVKPPVSVVSLDGCCPMTTLPTFLCPGPTCGFHCMLTIRPRCPDEYIVYSPQPIYSPLFGIRTEKAIEENTVKLQSSYVGENKEVIVPSIEMEEEIYESTFPSQLGEYTCSPPGCPPSILFRFCGATEWSGCLTLRPLCWHANIVVNLENLRQNLL